MLAVSSKRSRFPLSMRRMSHSYHTGALQGRAARQDAAGRHAAAEAWQPKKVIQGMDGLSGSPLLRGDELEVDEVSNGPHGKIGNHHGQQLRLDGWQDCLGMTLHPQPKLSSYLLSSALMHLSAA